MKNPRLHVVGFPQKLKDVVCDHILFAFGVCLCGEVEVGEDAVGEVVEMQEGQEVCRASVTPYNAEAVLGLPIGILRASFEDGEVTGLDLAVAEADVPDGAAATSAADASAGGVGVVIRGVGGVPWEILDTVNAFVCGAGAEPEGHCAVNEGEGVHRDEAGVAMAEGGRVGADDVVRLGDGEDGVGGVDVALGEAGGVEPEHGVGGPVAVERRPGVAGDAVPPLRAEGGDAPHAEGLGGDGGTAQIHTATSPHTPLANGRISISLYATWQGTRSTIFYRY